MLTLKGFYDLHIHSAPAPFVRIGDSAEIARWCAEAGMAGIVIKSHGGTDSEGFASAVDLGYDMIRYELLNKISDTLIRHAREEAAKVEAAS